MFLSRIIKNKIKAVVYLILFLSIAYFLIYFTQNIQIKHSLVKSMGKQLDEQHALIRCNLNIFEPEFAYVFFDENISFERMNKIFWSPKDWDNSYIGGTTVYNSSFIKNVEMLKKDCSQFKQDYNYEETYGDFERQKNEVYWKYSRKANLDDINIVEEGKEAVTNETETKIDKEWLEQNLKEYGFDNNEIKDILNKE